MEHIVPYCKIKIALDSPWNVFSQQNQFFTVVSCQLGSPASQRVDAKGLVCTLVRHVFLAENFQVCSFPKCTASGSPSHAAGVAFVPEVSAKVGVLEFKTSVGRVSPRPWGVACRTPPGCW